MSITVDDIDWGDQDHSQSATLPVPEAFLAELGRLLRANRRVIEFDYAAMEARVLAHLACEHVTSGTVEGVVNGSIMDLYR